MDHLIFWQTVGAVVIGNTLFAMTTFAYWKVGRREKEGGSIKDVSGWVVLCTILAPAVAIFSLYMLP